VLLTCSVGDDDEEQQQDVTNINRKAKMNKQVSSHQYASLSLRLAHFHLHTLTAGPWNGL